MKVYSSARGAQGQASPTMQVQKSEMEPHH